MRNHLPHDKAANGSSARFADILAATAADKARDPAGFDARCKARMDRWANEVIAEDELTARALVHYSREAAKALSANVMELAL